MRIAAKASVVHPGYRHYTTLVGLEAMLKNKSLWLTGLDSPSLNDGNEMGKYGSSKGWKDTYIHCFSYGKSECASMWKMYCKPSPDTVRIFVGQKAMGKWGRGLEHADFEAFAVVRIDGRVSVRERSLPVHSAELSDGLSCGGEDS